MVVECGGDGKCRGRECVIGVYFCSPTTPYCSNAVTTSMQLLQTSYQLVNLTTNGADTPLAVDAHACIQYNIARRRRPLKYRCPLKISYICQMASHRMTMVSSLNAIILLRTLDEDKHDNFRYSIMGRQGILECSHPQQQQTRSRRTARAN